MLSTGIGRAQSPSDSSGMFKIHVDMRTAVSQGSRARMGGTSVGWEWGSKRNEATLGYYWTGKRGRGDLAHFSHLAPFPKAYTGDVETDLRFMSAGYWMRLGDWDRWKLASPIEAGIGRARFTSKNSMETEVETLRTPIIPLQVGIYGEWKATRWLGAGIQTGYRHYATPDANVSLRSLHGIYYRFRVLLYLQTWYDWRDHLFRKQPLPSPFYQ